jgi:SAM-dependent methyltransferase
MESQIAEDLYVQLYDERGIGWPGELDFYREYAAAATQRGQPVLEAACGTGRISIPLAREGAQVTGFDLSERMIARAREKIAGLRNPRFEVADMRGFELGGPYGLAIIPGHSFMLLLTSGDQVACLSCIARHLTPDGTLIVHLDHPEIDWLGNLPAQNGVYEADPPIPHPQTGRPIRESLAWTYERATHIATAYIVYEELGPDGSVTGRWERSPIPNHVVFRYEMEHALARAGLRVEALYGSFERQEFRGDSSQMVWVARRA